MPIFLFPPSRYHANILKGKFTRAKLLPIVLPLILLAGGAISADVPDNEKGQADLKKLQGTWVCQELSDDGQSSPADYVAKITVAFKGDQMTVTNETAEIGTLTIHPEKKPPQIEVTDNINQVHRGIYEIKGDELTLCIAPAASKVDRPTKFEAPEGSKLMLMKLKRREATTAPK